MEVLELFTLNFGCILGRITNFVGNPGCTHLDLRCRNNCCGSCSVCDGKWYNLYLPVGYACVKIFLATKIAPKGQICYNTVLGDLWKYKNFGHRLFHAKNMKKYHFDNFLMQLVALRIIGLTVPVKTHFEKKEEDDS